MSLQSRNILIGAVIILAAAGIYIVNRQPVAPQVPPAPVVSQTPVKEFTMTSYYAPSERRAYFSLKELVVNKGDRVRIKVTNTAGSHDFVLDEYNLNQETPLNEQQTIEFTADKAGEFVYYCSRPGHRASGQWGTLKVLDVSPSQ